MVKSVQLTDFELLKKQRGNRVRILRTALRLSRRAFAEAHGIPRGTLQNWEDGRYGGLTEKGAIQLLDIMRAAGLYCSLEWLLHGIGEAPQVATAYGMSFPDAIKTQDIAIERVEYQEVAFIEEELALFRKHYYPHVLELQVSDDKMMPYYHQGDIVAGRKRYKQDIAKFIGQICLVQLIDGKLLVRELQSSQVANRYQLRYLHAEFADELKVQEVELISIAPITWHRRKDLFLG